ncbi:MAG TPA: NADP-dependent oxidoreductase [Lacisediminihabitans sp.]|uniref:NADP-dependent oxidoreductase n=1 Tax=Lacisediminihabitans sp. TaxID=2787631 RepID=UPI002ED839E6
MTTPPFRPTRTRAVRFDRYGGREVLTVGEVDLPELGPGEVLVQIRAAGINPGEAIIRSGLLHDRLPATFPSGQGTDLAGVVVETAADVSAFVAGDEVLGFSWARSSHAGHVVVPAPQLIAKPKALSWEVAGALDVAGTTAYAAVRAVRVQPGDVVAVSAATGGVGTLVVQLLVRHGARVLGIASSTNADWLVAHEVTPIEYGDGLEDRLRAAAPDGIDAFIDLFGPGYVRLAARLGVPTDRINTIVVSDAAVELATRMDGAGALTFDEAHGALGELADALAAGTIELPIAATYPLDRVVDAFEELERRHSFGKIVLVP